MSESLAQIEKLVNEGRFLEARTRSEFLQGEKDHVRLRRLLALSMAKSGAPKAAMDILEPVYHEHPDDPEISGILGSIYKELFKETKLSRYAVLSRDTYLNNYRLTGNYYTGVNAASMFTISGSVSTAKEIARELITQLSPSASDLWQLATLAEAHLLLRDKDKAIELYLKCRYLIGSDWWKITSIFNQLWLLDHYIPVPTQIISIFSPPSVAAFVGHMIDHPARDLSRFPASIEAEIKSGITAALQSVNAKIGYCSMACGGDILFAEAMAESGGEVNFFLPFDEADFLETSVMFAGGNWLQRYNDLKHRFPVNKITTERYMGNDDLFSFQSQVIFGSALHRAALLHSSPHLITVFSDIDILKQVGGTYDTIKFWPADKNRININPQHYINSPVTGNSNGGVATSANIEKPRSRMRRVCFMVCISFRDCTAEQQHRVHYYVDKKIKDLDVTAIDRNDHSLLFAFSGIEDAAALAWGLLKIPILSGVLKITLHAGPVDTEAGVTITGHGADIIRKLNEHSAAGKIYSSFQFASILSLQSDGYAVEYAGVVTVAGQSISMFQVNRHADAFDLV